ncbi:MAG: inorganic phosphate transporter [Candidatus Cloacimonadota bacterium]|nr:MAG: inorganic phosphate transporter [Candidatus Cloacimonadota bacterium]
MNLQILIYLSGALFLGWSLGANNAANFFGTAVATRMLKFRTAAVICSVFVLLGASVSGVGASQTLGKLGQISAIAGAFTVSLSAALVSFFMTRAGIPISTGQAVVGGIIGWNFFSGNSTDYRILGKILGTWVFSPILAAAISFLLYHLVKLILNSVKIHLIRLDAVTRHLLIIVGAFGSYSLGANNIGNVMGIFMKLSPFKDLNIADVFIFSSVQQLFLMGGIAIAVGVITYSQRVMMTVGSGIFKLSPVTALTVVLSTSLTLFLFASQELRGFLLSVHLPAFPLVPVSSSQAVVGSVIGISFARGAWNSVNYRILGKISLGWIITPAASALTGYISLFFMQNVFRLKVF